MGMRKTIVAFLAVVPLIGCDSKPPFPAGFEDQVARGRTWFATLDAARDSAPFVSDFLRLYPRARVSYVYFAGPEPGYNLEADLFERYELLMQLPVEFDSSGKKVTGYGEPKFYLHEVESVERLADGRSSTSYRGSSQRVFGSAEWRKIVDAGGDFRAVGYTMTKDQPVPGFKDRKTLRQP
jgi:hypothetical protein